MSEAESIVSQEQPAVTSSAQCIECSEAIAASAKKCRHCGAYQRRYHRWTGPLVTVLSLLVAIVSLVLGGVEKIKDLIHPRTPLFAVLEEADDRNLTLLIHNESDDSIVVEDMICFMAFSAEPGEVRFMDSSWMGDQSSIISPGNQTRLSVQWMASSEVSRLDYPNGDVPRGSVSIRRWQSTCGCDPGRDTDELIQIPITICRLSFRTSRNLQGVYDFRAPALDQSMRQMIDEWEPPEYFTPTLEDSVPTDE